MSHGRAWEWTQDFSIEVRRLSAWTITHSLVLFDVSEYIIYGINTSYQCWDSNLGPHIPQLVAVQINQKNTSDQWDTFRQNYISYAVIFQSSTWHRRSWSACTFPSLQTNIGISFRKKVPLFPIPCLRTSFSSLEVWHYQVGEDSWCGLSFKSV
jgi:hypothetical protein